MAADEAVGCTCEFLTMRRSSQRLVYRGRPEPSLRPAVAGLLSDSSACICRSRISLPVFFAAVGVLMDVSACICRSRISLPVFFAAVGVLMDVSACLY
ncbi:hypothetical protein TNCV_3853971 [Trichonephila clavipes]|nr:hypothetical protein TNCV_3853971 [Trichonephila clavipes]